MAEAQDIVHQIEYRWHDRLDLSPIACSMSQESLRGWDAWIRDWVRHPHVEGLGESLCYQIHPNGRAALAWRYEDWQAAEREDGTRGRPLVSRVLAGQASLLTPEVALVLCRNGLPAAAGPQPGRVTAETRLPVIRADELSGLVSERAARLDQEAARQDGLRQVVASALSDLHTPLAIHVRGTYILKPPGEGLQCLLLWGLRRIVWPLVGTGGRGWSFSTFEPPLGGDVDPATLPDILFRQTQDTPPSAPARPRKEIKSRPFDPSTLDDRTTLAQLAEALVAEYRERGGEELRKVIADWCGTERSLLPRVHKVYTELSARHSPIVISGPASPFVPVSAARTPKRQPNPPLVPAESRESAPFEAGEPTQAEPVPAGPELAGPAEGVPLEGEAAVSPPVPSPARDRSGPVSGGPTLAGDQQIPEQQAKASQAGAGEVPDRNRDWAWPGHQDRLPRQGESGDQRWFEDEDQRQAGYAQPPDDGWLGDTADRESGPRGPYPEENEEDIANPEQAADPDYPADQGHGGDLPYMETSSWPLQPDVSSRPAARDRAMPAYSERSWASRGDNALGQVQREGKPPELASRSQSPRSPADQNLQVRGLRPTAISDLLKKLPAAADDHEFNSLLHGILSPDSQPDTADRVKARREVSKGEWYKNILEKFGKILWVNELAMIFQIIVIPDLEDPTVAKKIADWAEYAQPVIIASLLTASRISGDDSWHSMMHILQPKLAYRWTIIQHMEVLWDPSMASQPASDSGRGRFGFFRRN